MEQAPPLPRFSALSQACRAHGFELSDPVLHGLDVYLELLLKWNKAMNLVGHAGREEILEDLILDSFHLAAFLEGLPLPAAPECWDFGAGAGLPGIPLRLLWPTEQAGNYWLVEAREKRALFLQNVLAALPLPGTRVWRGRVENFMATAKAADLLISRAFMPWPQLLELVRGKLAPRGLVVCLTLEGAPPSLPENLAGHWRLLRSHRYSPSALKPEKIRHFWAFEQIQRG